MVALGWPVVALRSRSKTTSTTASTMGTSSSGSLGLRFGAGPPEFLPIRFTPALYQAGAWRGYSLAVLRVGWAAL